MGMGLETALCPFGFSLKKENFCALIFFTFGKMDTNSIFFFDFKRICAPILFASFRRKKRIAAASEEARCTALSADAESSVSACSFFLSKL